jgi:hypothetical protein
MEPQPASSWRWVHVVGATACTQLEIERRKIFGDESGSVAGDESPQIGGSHGIITSFYECEGVLSTKGVLLLHRMLVK